MLGLVISQMAESPRKWMSFRNSKLTRLLQPSLGGNSRTAIIATIHPGVQHADVSIATLRFAARAMKVQSMYGVKETATAALQTNKLQQDMDALIAPVLKKRISTLESTQACLQDQVSFLNPPLQSTSLGGTILLLNWRTEQASFFRSAVWPLKKLC